VIFSFVYRGGGGWGSRQPLMTNSSGPAYAADVFTSDRLFVCLSVCLSVRWRTEKIVNGF